MDNQVQVVDRLTYNKSVNRLGRWTVVICVLAFLLPAIGLAVINHIPVNWQMFAAAAIPLLLTYAPSAICENLSYAPIIGSGGLYVGCITGNLGNLKIPAALNAMSLIDEEPGTEKADIASVLAISSSSIVTMIIVFLGMLFLAPLMAPLLSAEWIQPAFTNLVPALQGAIVAPYIKKNPKEAIVPFLLPIAIIFIIGRATYSANQGYMMPVLIIVSCIYSYFLHKNELKKA